MSDWRKTKISPDASIRGAIASIDSSALQIALVVKPDDTLLGTVTDGDIRRGILRGISLDQPVEQIMQRRPQTIGPQARRGEAVFKMQRAKIKQMPRIDDEGRVIGLESLSELLAPTSLETWVVLMAGGLGRRLRPLTDDTPKPLLPVGGKPLLLTILEGFIAQGFERFFLSVNHMAEQFEEFFGDGERWGVRISYVHEDRPLGTAGALSLLPEPPTSPIIVMNGDLLTAVDFRHLLDFHHLQEAAATMCVRDYSIEVPYGVAVIDNHRLTGLSEKPRHRFFVNAGIYVLGPEALARVPRERPFDMTELFEKLIEEGRETTVFPIREYWLDIGQTDDLDQARGDFPKIFGDTAS